MSGIAGEHAPGGHVSDAEGSDDGCHMRDSAPMHAAKPAVAARGSLHASEEEVSDSECPLPVKRRTTQPAKLKAAPKRKAGHPEQASGGASPIAGDGENGSDVESPVTAVTKPSKKNSLPKKRSKAHLESEHTPHSDQGIFLFLTSVYDWTCPHAEVH